MFENRLFGRSGGRCTIGFSKISEIDPHVRSIIKFDGDIKIYGSVNFGLGSVIIVEKGAQLAIGKNFVNTGKLTISSNGMMTIGENVLISWDTWIADHDFHATINVNTNEVRNPIGECRIGDGVWLGSGVKILKDSVIPDGCIVAAGAVVRKRFEDKYSVIAGNPAVVKKIGETISW